MTAHSCKTFDPTCYRCDLGLDELRFAQLEDLREAATDARHNSFNGMNEWEDALADVFDATLSGLSPERRSLSAEGPYAQAVFTLARQYLLEEEEEASQRQRPSA